VLFVYLYKVGFNNIALLSALGITDSQISLQMHRLYMGNALEGRCHWCELFMHDFLRISPVAFF
jgi:hypothetical protein